LESTEGLKEGTLMLERDFYILPVAASRLACTADDLLHLGMKGRAQICVDLFGKDSGCTRTRIQAEATHEAPVIDALTEHERQAADATDVNLERRKASSKRAMPDGVYELGGKDLRWLALPGKLRAQLHSAFKFDGNWWECKFDPPVDISAYAHACMLHEEVVRLDREVFSIEAPAQMTSGAAEGPRWPNHTTKKLEALREAANRFWGQNYDPNQPDTAPKNEAVIAWLVEKHGIGKTPASEMASILRPEGLRPGPR
jgi:hypothetical protein